MRWDLKTAEGLSYSLPSPTKCNVSFSDGQATDRDICYKKKNSYRCANLKTLVY